MKPTGTKWIITCLTLCSLLIHFTSLSQDLGTRGKTFWFGFMENIKTGNTPELSVTITSDRNVTGTVSAPLGAFNQNFTVAAGSATQVSIPIEYLNKLTGTYPTGLLVQASDTVSVYAVQYRDASFDAAIVLPAPALGSEYIVGSYLSFNNMVNPSEFIIVGVQNNTLITYQLGGVTQTLSLNRGQVFQFQDANDVTGARITSENCVPFAVFAGGACLNVPNTCTTCDHIFDQMLPVNTWGLKYVGIPYRTSEHSLYRIIALEDNTKVKIDDGTITNVNLNSRQFYEKIIINKAIWIEADKPIGVFQFADGFSCNQTGDPSYVQLNPVEQGLRDIIFASYQTTRIANHYTNVLVPTTSVKKVRLNGILIPFTDFKAVPNHPEFMYARVKVNQGYNRLQAPEPLNAYVYGFGPAESYVYSAGSELRNLLIDFAFNPPLCVGKAVNFTSSIIGGGAAVAYAWTFGDGGSSIVANPVHTYTNPGTYKVTLKVTRGANTCGTGTKVDSVVKYLVVSDGVVLQAGKDTTICQGQTVELWSSGAHRVKWYPSYGLNSDSVHNPEASPGQTTQYMVVAPDSGCGTDTARVKIEVEPMAVAEAYWTRNGLTVDLKAGDSRGETSFFWDFGDRSTPSTDKETSHTYVQGDDFVITLIVENHCGRDTLKFTLKVTPSGSDSGDAGVGIEDLEQAIMPIQPLLNPVRWPVQMVPQHMGGNTVAHGSIQLSVLDYQGRLLARESFPLDGSGFWWDPGATGPGFLVLEWMNGPQRLMIKTYPVIP